MKVILFNGSTHANGCTAQALEIVAQTLQQQGIDTEILSIGTQAVHDCIACGGCRKGTPACVFKDDSVNTFIEKAKTADGFIFGSPVYYAHPSGAILSAMDRLFFAGGQFLRHKPAAAILTARRAGTTASMLMLKLGKGAYTIFTGQNNAHNFTEWLSEEDMFKSYWVALNIIDEVATMREPDSTPILSAQPAPYKIHPAEK